MATRPLNIIYKVGDEVTLDIGDVEISGLCVVTEVNARQATLKRKSDGTEFVVAMTEDEPLNLEPLPPGDIKLRGDGHYHYGDNWENGDARGEVDGG